MLTLTLEGIEHPQGEEADSLATGAAEAERSHRLRQGATQGTEAEALPRPLLLLLNRAVLVSLRTITSSKKTKKKREGCFVNFEFANHTIITSKCKGPNYPPKECYGAFKEFACPYADVLNDLQNDIYLRIQERTGLIPGVDEHELQDKVDKTFK
ncbi:uncharacterized protein LOC107619229 isoform X2 [Arachis ipaensis]|uniref:GPI-anchored protein LLG1-like domain-containing protein n=1 Tax=Arachis hypogaea TaxID=3818 RepID=A0A444XNI9_ARAHY|nr:uncharacterized protein LOC107619229 isoform X2 [Arachis ipaensis]XP_025676680.1 uncharacterized protein LOC112776664 isoform X2 [Arachis hypogaea]QHN77793.1 uncharacterized protein DS421_19g655880 [Arachis hypogaea]RYQ91253.1 hypothetical protein Ahy_B09g097145 [Arachis hypogaea]